MGVTQRRERDPLYKAILFAPTWFGAMGVSSFSTSDLRWLLSEPGHQFWGPSLPRTPQRLAQRSKATDKGEFARRCELMRNEMRKTGVSPVPPQTSNALGKCLKKLVETGRLRKTRDGRYEPTGSTPRDEVLAILSRRTTVLEPLGHRRLGPDFGDPPSFAHAARALRRARPVIVAHAPRAYSPEELRLLDLASQMIERAGEIVEVIEAHHPDPARFALIFDGDPNIAAAETWTRDDYDQFVRRTAEKLARHAEQLSGQFGSIEGKLFDLLPPDIFTLEESTAKKAGR